jgi:excisionase family DNA binding protein
MSAPTLEQLRSRLFLNVTEAAALLEVDPRTLRRSIDAGKCPHVRISGVVRIPVPAFLQWAEIDLENSEAAVITPRLAQMQPTKTKKLGYPDDYPPAA